MNISRFTKQLGRWRYECKSQIEELVNASRRQHCVDVFQIMDPKMDSGYLIGKDTLEDDYNVLRELVPEEVIGIMDQMLCFEVGSEARRS